MRDDVHADDKSTVSGYSSAPGRPPVADGGASNSSKASNSSINVSVRLRPLSEKERVSFDDELWAKDDEKERKSFDHKLWDIDMSYNLGDFEEERRRVDHELWAIDESYNIDDFEKERRRVDHELWGIDESYNIDDFEKERRRVDHELWAIDESYNIDDFEKERRRGDHELWGIDESYSIDDFEKERRRVDHELWAIDESYNNVYMLILHHCYPEALCAVRRGAEKERRRGDHELWGIDESFNIGYYAGKEHTFVPKYKYDQVFGPSSHNYEVFNAIACLLVEPSLNGINGTIFAYGVTSSGKTQMCSDVFNAIARPLVEPSLNGINGTIFAYGVTSSGKTHTMMGDVEAAMGHTSNGIVPQTIKELFDQANAAEGRVFKIRLSMMEIYNEVLNDLLDPSRTNLKVREDSHHGVAVDGLSEEVVATAEQALTWILSGEANRQTSCTAYNEDSSRSHTICRLLIEVQEGSGPKGTKKTRSVLSLIDLAGSESAKGQRMEGSFINKSLLTLGTVINKLAEGHATHIPFRDSKLTRLLQNSLSGKGAQIALICNITPASAQGEETQNTLKFATRAKLVRVTVCRNEVVDDKAMLRRFATENRELRCQLKLLQDSMEANQTDVTGDTDLEGLTSVRLRGLVRHLLEKRASLAAAAEAVANVSKRGSLASAAEAEVNVSKRASLAGLQEAESNVSKRASIASASEDEANVSKRASLATAAEAESNMSKRTSLASAAEAEVNMSKRSSLAGQQEAEANVAKRTSIASAAEAEAHASKRVSLAGQQEGQEHKDGSDGATEEGALAPALATHGSASSDQELSTLSPALLQPMPEPPSAVPLQEPPTATRLSLLVDFSPTATDVAALDLGDALVGAGGGGAEEEEDDDYGSDSGVEALILAMREDMMIDVQSFEDLSLGIDPIHTQLVAVRGAQDLVGR
eukprot:gene30099-35065_t